MKELNMWKEMKTKQRLSIPFAIARESASVSCFLPGRELESFTVGEKGGFSYVPTGGCWHREAAGRLTRSGKPT